MANNKKINAGESVYVVERDECGNPVAVSGFIFLAQVNGAVIATPRVNNYDLDGILEYHIEITAEDEETGLSVFPVKDCYAKREDAQAAYAKEMEG